MVKVLPKPYFLFGDCLSVMITGALACIVALAVTPSGWPMILAMIPAMLSGMIVALILAPLVFVRYFGAMEVMVPSMLGAMLAGMWAGMKLTMSGAGYTHAAIDGALIGAASLVFCYLFNMLTQVRDTKVQHERSD
ncbi:MAG: hypothetical protein KJP04_03060 [Arenicella sp.]|nr:hypothetical protein [Arenicella sp.]